MPLLVLSQTFNDGPIELRVKVRTILVTAPIQDWAIFGLGAQPDEHTFKLWIRDNADIDGLNWIGGTCLQYDGDPPYISSDFNSTIFSYTYPGTTVPQYFDLRLDAWQDNCGSDAACDSTRCDFNSTCCCGFYAFGVCVGITTDDKVRCNANPYKTKLNYRAGPPCQWFNHGYIVGGTCGNDFYNPEIESFWRYTNGETCSNAIDLGTLTPGNTLYHYNSNECYANDYGMPGNDVFYKFTINKPMGVKASLCGNTLFNSIIYLLDGACNLDTLNDDFCANKSEISTSICNPGTYYIVVDGVSTSDMGTFELTIEEDPTLTFNIWTSKTDISCTGANDGTAIVYASGGFPPYSFSWSNGINDTIITNLAPGTYIAYVTDSRSCTISDTVTILEPPPLNFSITSTNATCFGVNDSIATATANGGTPPYIYIWNTTPVQNTQTAIQLAPGSYTVTVADINGCTVTDTFSIGSNSQIIINKDYINNITCNGANDGSIGISITGGIAPYSYNWSNGANSEDISNLGPGYYTVNVTDTLGCLAIDSFYVFEPPPLLVTLDSIHNVSCYGESGGAIDISVSGGSPPYQFQWNNGTTIEDLIAVPAGTYNVIITDTNNCVINYSNSISEPDSITASAVVTKNSCEGNMQGKIDLSVSGGVPPYSFQWSNGANSEDIDNLATGNYSVVISDNNSCTFYYSVDVGENAPLNINFNINHASCNDKSDGSVKAIISGGNPPYTFYWKTNTVYFDSVLTNIPAGLYMFYVIDSAGCTDSALAEVHVHIINPDSCIDSAQQVVAIPNAFTPNGDGLNDKFSIRAFNVKNIEISIFNRWGELLYENKNFLKSDGWDGKYKGNPLPQGIYIYKMEIELLDGSIRQKFGNISLLK